MPQPCPKYTPKFCPCLRVCWEKLQSPLYLLGISPRKLLESNKKNLTAPRLAMTDKQVLRLSLLLVYIYKLLDFAPTMPQTRKPRLHRG